MPIIIEFDHDDCNNEGSEAITQATGTCRTCGHPIATLTEVIRSECEACRFHRRDNKTNW